VESEQRLKWLLAGQATKFVKRHTLVRTIFLPCAIPVLILCSQATELIKQRTWGRNGEAPNPHMLARRCDSLFTNNLVILL
jgi:hypothetical protein